MKLGSTVLLQGVAGDHGTLNGNKCPGRHFHVLQVGVGGVYQNLVKCTLCHLELAAYGDQVVDPFASAVSDQQLTDSTLYGIRTTYRFRHNNANGVDSNPDMWFTSQANADNAFGKITPEAAIKAWPRTDQIDVLESATVSLGLRERNQWRELHQKVFKVKNGSLIVQG